MARLAEKLNADCAEPRILRADMFNKLNEFLEDFGTRNIFADDQLLELTRQVNRLVGGVMPENIRDNEVMRQKIRNGMNSVKEAIDEAIEDIPRRKIRLTA